MVKTKTINRHKHQNPKQSINKQQSRLSLGLLLQKMEEKKNLAMFSDNEHKISRHVCNESCQAKNIF